MLIEILPLTCIGAGFGPFNRNINISVGDHSTDHSFVLVFEGLRFERKGVEYWLAASIAGLSFVLFFPGESIHVNDAKIWPV